MENDDRETETRPPKQQSKSSRIELPCQACTQPSTHAREGKKKRREINVEQGREGGERDAGIICVIIYDTLALEAWTQRKERERERGAEGHTNGERQKTHTHTHTHSHEQKKTHTDRPQTHR